MTDAKPDIAPDLAADPTWGPVVRAADVIARDQVGSYGERFEWRRTRADGQDAVELTIHNGGHAGVFTLPLAELRQDFNARFLARMAWDRLITSRTNASFNRIQGILAEMLIDAEADEARAGAAGG